MKKFFPIVAVLGFVAAAFAAPTGPGYFLNIGGSQAGNTGGAFKVTTKVGGKAAPNIAANGSWASLGYAIGAQFNTFCVEQVSFSPGSDYYASIDNEVYSGADSPISLSAGTKNVYAKYIDGGSFGAIGLIDTAVELTVMQAYIWLQESVYDNVAALPSAHQTAWNNNAAIVAAIQGVGSTANPHASRVKVLNLWDGFRGGNDFRGDAQSQLIYVVPAPAAALLGLFGLGAGAWAKRRVS